METRPYFIAGDLLTNAATGALVGLVMAWLFGPHSNMFVAMLVGMAVGMALSMPLALLLGALFGAMEVMLPAMTTGMVAGMVVSMAASMGEVELVRGAGMGTASGVGVLIATYLANALIRSRASQWTS